MLAVPGLTIYGFNSSGSSKLAFSDISGTAPNPGFALTAIALAPKRAKTITNAKVEALIAYGMELSQVSKPFESLSMISLSPFFIHVFVACKQGPLARPFLWMLLFGAFSDSSSLVLFFISILPRAEVKRIANNLQKKV
jgi:hypothetical protein